MTKGQLLKEVSTALDLPTAEIDRVLQQLLTEIACHLKAGNQVMIKGFGKFKPRKAQRKNSDLTSCDLRHLD